MNRFIKRFIALLALYLGRLLSSLPLTFQRWVASGIGDLVYLSSVRRRRIAETNLSICFPEWSESKRAAETRKFFRRFSIALVDLFWLWHAPQREIERRVRLSGVEHLRAADLGSGRAVVVLAPHFLGIDAGGVRLQLDLPLVCLYTSQSIPMVDQWVRRGRTRFHRATLVSRQEGIGKLARLLRAGVSAHFSPDMDFGPKGAVFAPFFQEPAATPTSLVRLARMANATVVPMVTRITPEGYEARFYPGWRYTEADDLQASVAALNQKIEAWIREDPSQYLWTHRRFKTRPPGAPSVYS